MSARRPRPVAETSSLVAAAALAAMLFASRLPPGPRFFLPRRGGYVLYRAAWALFAAPAGRAAFSAAVALLLAASAAGWAYALAGAVRGKPRSWSARAGLAAGPLFAAFLAARIVSHALDAVQSVWFPYGAMDGREPFAAFALFAPALVAAAVAARAWAAGERRRAALWLGALVAADMALALGNAACGVGRPLGVPEPEGKTLYLVLAAGERGPTTEAYALAPDVFAGADPRPVLRALAARPRDARALPALRALYEEETKRWDPAGLRDALLLGVARRDPLAVSVLLAHAASAAPSPETLAALGAAADESEWRIGPLGAAALARAYARQGDSAAAGRWAAKAGGPEGIAPGLLGAEAAGALKPGRIAGVLRSPVPARAALYARADPAAPYLLDAAGFVAAAAPDAKGRFSFSGLPAGRYYLAVALPGAESRRGEVSVSGSRGDLVLDARRPSLDLPPLTVQFTPR